MHTRILPSDSWIRDIVMDALSKRQTYIRMHPDTISELRKFLAEIPIHWDHSRYLSGSLFDFTGPTVLSDRTVTVGGWEYGLAAVIEEGAP